MKEENQIENSCSFKIVNLEVMCNVHELDPFFPVQIQDPEPHQN